MPAFRFLRNGVWCNIRHRDSERPSFDDATGDLSGAFVTGREISGEPGLLPYIWVDAIDAVLARVKEHGGEIVQGSRPDAPGQREPDRDVSRSGRELDGPLWWRVK